MATLNLAIAATSIPNNWTLTAGTSKVQAVATADTTTAYISSGTTNNTQQQFTVADPSVPSGTTTIDSVAVQANCQRGGSQNVNYVVTAIVGANTSAGTGQTANASWVTTTTTFATKPGGGAWTWTDVANMEVRIQNTQARDLRCTFLQIVVTYTVSVVNGTATGKTLTETLSFSPGTASGNGASPAGATLTLTTSLQGPGAGGGAGEKTFLYYQQITGSGASGNTSNRRLWWNKRTAGLRMLLTPHVTPQPDTAPGATFVLNQSFVPGSASGNTPGEARSASWQAFLSLISGGATVTDYDGTATGKTLTSTLSFRRGAASGNQAFVRILREHRAAGGERIFARSTAGQAPEPDIINWVGSLHQTSIAALTASGSATVGTYVETAETWTLIQSFRSGGAFSSVPGHAVAPGVLMVCNQSHISGSTTTEAGGKTLEQTLSFTGGGNEGDAPGATFILNLRVFGGAEAQDDQGEDDDNQGGRKKSRRSPKGRRYTVLIDDLEYEVSSPDEAYALLQDAKDRARIKAEEAKQRTTVKRPKKSVVRVIKHKLSPPDIKIKGKDRIADELNAEAKRIAEDIARQNAEILAELERRWKDEEEALALLL